MSWFQGVHGFTVLGFTVQVTAVYPTKFWVPPPQDVLYLKYDKDYSPFPCRKKDDKDEGKVCSLSH